MLLISSSTLAFGRIKGCGRVRVGDTVVRFPKCLLDFINPSDVSTSLGAWLSLKASVLILLAWGSVPQSILVIES